jgi:Ankyrin repeats (3 copies)
MKHNPISSKTYTFIKKLLWWGSMIGMCVFLINTRHDFQLRHSVDLYFAALENNDASSATSLLANKELDVSYFDSKMQQKMSPQALQAGLDSATSVLRNSYEYVDDSGIDDNNIRYRGSSGKLCKEFLDKGAKPTEQLLIHSLEKYHTDIARRCLTNGVKGDGAKGDNYPIIIISKNLHADSTDDANFLELLFEHKVNLNRADSEGNTPLHYIAGNYVDYSNYDSDNYASKVVAKMIQHGADPNQKNRSGRTPLHIAVENSSSMVTKTLLEAGANPNCIWYGSSEGDANDHGKLARISLLRWAKDNVTSKHPEDGIDSKAARDFERKKVVQLLERYGAKENLTPAD